MLAVNLNVSTAWGVQPLTAKLYLICLLAAAAHTIFFLTRTLFRLHRLPQDALSNDENRQVISFVEMTNGMDNLRQLHALLLVLFGGFFAMEMFAAFRGVRYASLSLSGATMDIFEGPTEFAFVVFAVLVCLHVFQWAVAARLRAYVFANVPPKAT